LENGKTIRCTVMENLDGPMDENTQGFMLMIRNKDMEYFNGVLIFFYVMIVDGSKYVGEWLDGK
jgi:hypothetical protein